MESVAGGSGMQGYFKEEDSVVEERAEDESRSEDENREGGSQEGEMGSSEIKVVDEVRKDKGMGKGGAADEKKVKEERREEEKDRERWRSRIRSGSVGQVWRRDAGARARSRSRSRRRRGSGSSSRCEAGLCLGARKVFLDDVGL